MFRQNYLKACQILIDISSQLLRALCKKEDELFGYKVPDSLSERDFTFLVDHLISPRERLVRGRAFPGSFFLFASCHVSLSSIDAEKPLPPSVKRKWTELKVLKWDEGFQGIPDSETIVVNQVKSKFTKSADENVLYLHRVFSKGELDNRNIEVYFGTKIYNAVELLRHVRNESISHPSTTHMSDDEFKTLFDNVTKCFEVLEAERVLIQALQKLKPGIA